MSINLGTPDRIVRLVLGVIAVLWALFGAASSLWFWVLLIVGIALIGTAGISFCPIYAMLGLRTDGKK